MTERDIFKNISPLDHRYYLANKETFEKLSLYLSEEAAIRYSIRVEAALLKAHIDFHCDADAALKEQLESLETAISPEAVYREEEKTQHNIRALVNVIKMHVPEEVRHFVHLGATSVDILDTANALRVKEVIQNVILPVLLETETHLIRIAAEEAGTPQVGRTHGQFAVPITFGFALSEYISRLGKSVLYIWDKAQDVRGKCAGAVGAYNSTSMLVEDPEAFEKRFLSYLGLEASEHSTQMVEPEYVLRVLLEVNIAFGILANLADDLRNLQRSEIGELRESFKKGQVGSSTMPQKRNPWNSEHIKSLWKAFSPRIQSFFMDQISEHQRDLTNSASSRFITDYLAGFTAAAVRTNKVLSSLYVDREGMRKNLDAAGDMVLSEAAYILLASMGESEAHEIIRTITLECEEKQQSLISVMKNHAEAWNKIEQRLSALSGIDPEHFFSTPSEYRGRAQEKALAICDTWSENMKILKKELL